MLQITNLKKTFGKNTQNENVALDNLNLHVKSGDFITIIGSNGAGKSTLFNAVSGVFMTDHGTILLDGKNITLKEEHTRAKAIGRLFQDPLKGTAPNMSIEENLVLALLRGRKKSPFKLAVSKKNDEFFKKELAKLDLGLEERLSSMMGLLSGGQRQAVTLLMATLVTPKLLLLDEHTAALDPSTAQKVLALTKEVIEKDKITALMITHNIQDAIDYGNRLIMMNSGKIVMDYNNDEKKMLTPQKLMEEFKEKSKIELVDDRILLSS